MKNLYDILELNLDASYEEIKKKYHELSKRNHPDKTGSDKIQVEINLAYETLSDPVSRKKYDETGEVSQISTTESEIISELIQAFISIMDNHIEIEIDGFALLKDRITKAKISNMNEIKGSEKRIKYYNKLKTKVKSKNQNNIFKHGLNNAITMHNDKIAECKKTIEKHETMLSMLENYEWEKVLAIGFENEKAE